MPRQQVRLCGYGCCHCSSSAVHCGGVQSAPRLCVCTGQLGSHLARSLTQACFTHLGRASHHAHGAALPHPHPIHPAGHTNFSEY